MLDLVCAVMSACVYKQLVTVRMSAAFAMKRAGIVLAWQLVGTAPWVDLSAIAADAVSVTLPVIASFTPDSGRPGASVYITGDNLGQTSQVEFNGVEAPFTVNEPESAGAVILTEVPRNASSGPVSVVTPAGRATSSVPFSVVRLAPAISGFTPAGGTVGTEVIINGSNLYERNITVVRFNGVQAGCRAGAQNLTDPELIALVPANATTGPLTVETSSGTNTTSVAFTITNIVYRPPVVTQFTPTHGAEGESVRLEGTNLTGMLSIQFNGVEAPFYSDSDPQSPSWFAIVPANATTGPIKITTQGGSYTTPASFTVTQPPAPLLTRFEPASGKPGSTVMLYGSNLDRVTGVRFNGTATEFTLFLAGQMPAQVPPNATSGPITVEGKGGTNTTAVAFVVQHELAIRALANGQVELSWPTQAVAFVVQSTDHLTVTPVWTTRNGAAVIVQGRQVVIDTVSGASRFYRLNGP